MFTFSSINEVNYSVFLGESELFFHKSALFSAAKMYRIKTRSKLYDECVCTRVVVWIYVYMYIYKVSLALVVPKKYQNNVVICQQ